MAKYQTPGVYVEEISTLPPSVAGVATAIPAFIGFTEKAPLADTNFSIKRISNMLEYEMLFGRGARYIENADTVYKVEEDTSHNKTYRPQKTDAGFHMYDSVRLFFANGGGSCYIVSIGQYGNDKYQYKYLKDKEDIKNALEAVANIDEVTLISMPDAVAYSYPFLASLQQKALSQCETSHDRIALLDIKEDKVDVFRQNIGMESLDFGSAYTPNLNPVYTPELSFCSILAAGLETVNYKNLIKNSTPLLSAKLNSMIQLYDDNIEVQFKNNIITTTPNDGVVKIEVEKGEESAVYEKGENGVWEHTTGVSLHKNTLTKHKIELKDISDAEKYKVKAFVVYNPDILSNIVTDCVLDINEDGTVQLPRLIKNIEIIYREKNTQKVMVEVGTVPDDYIPGTPIEIKDLLSTEQQVILDTMDSIQIISKQYKDFNVVLSYEEIDKNDTLDMPTAANKIVLNYTAKDEENSATIELVKEETWKSLGEHVSFNAENKKFEFNIDIESNISVTYYKTSSAIPDNYFSEAEQALILKAVPECKAYADRVISNFYTVCPPSGAIAGIMAKTDRNKGVWAAPANASINDIKGLTRHINDDIQSRLNVDPNNGKSINAIREFIGKGFMVWGARTLDGNSNEWRYVSVRRFYNYVEESVKKSTAWAVFQPNNLNTWAQLQGQIENFLTELWRLGALAGANPEEAFTVHVGKGVSMTEEQILAGELVVIIGLATVRPAEFVILQFSHKVQK